MLSYGGWSPFESSMGGGFGKYSPIGCCGLDRRPIEPYCCDFGTDGLPAATCGLGLIIGSGYPVYDPCVSSFGCRNDGLGWIIWI